ncbi:hypothetical protein I6A84_41925 [Frankia sp. CNm7]|uniref:Uncharacterized protein n=1 Tax=Frankia nepalensis TaxID=1836974 RepID=A0A937UMA6_9ACTN|nr:hypothetical protein [Frankia nepalensis]MBL7497158.1 hypothetical protein [Frankia nepalensis]MBL7513100.1 hypothetical protein [Frankia nepalensis]MBL7524425.1 hypothetical protein [Frankia nepalensis]MBL7626863.1 hypothetical protein [Frankia nepalensis]
MPKFDLSKVNIVPYVSLADASVQDHSTRDRQFPGLHNDLLFLWAMVDTENGKRYELIRMLSASGTFDFILHECPTDLWAHPTTVRFPFESDLYWGPILWLDSDGRQTVFPLNSTAKQSLKVSLGPDEYVWKEDGGLIDVVLTPRPMNVTTIYVPGLPDDVGYTSSGCTVTGSIAGSKITGGYGGLDRMYCLPGLSAMVSKIAELEHYWFVWGSILEDGRWETGNAMLGTGNYATATFQRDGEPPIIATNDEVESKVIWETKGDVRQPRLASLTFGGRTFSFEGTHNAAAAAVSLGIAWLHGTVREEGGPKPVRSWSTMEVIKIRATPRD